MSYRTFLYDNKGENNYNKRIKRSKSHIGLEDYIKASKKANREAEQEMLGPGFHSLHRVHKSKKTYTRKEKHRNNLQ